DPEKNRDKVGEMLKEVPKLTQKIAGKSIPLEKFVSRKARKFHLQDRRLFFPWLEILYIFNGFDTIPSATVTEHLAAIDAALSKLESSGSATSDHLPYATYADDVCLARFLKGVLIREEAYPHAQTLMPVEELARLPVPEARVEERLSYAARQLEFVISQAHDIKLDHWILPFARFELGQLYMRSRAYPKARREYEAALNGGVAEDEAGSAKKKASLENMLHFRAHNALVKL
ncbi:hypothetical protein BDK51DRAFT_11597, partial [Blyttiomyces helicus]